MYKRQGLDDGDPGRGLRLLLYAAAQGDGEAVLALGGVDDALGPVAEPVGEDDVLARLESADGDGVPPLGAVQHELRPGGHPFDDEDRCGHRGLLMLRAVRAASSSAASSSISSPAGSSRAMRWPCPAHRAMPWASPALAAAWRSPLVT